MNSSSRTTLVAKGIYLFAALQNLPGSQTVGSNEEKAWNEFREWNPTLALFCINEQCRLFDRVNARSWA